MGWLKNIITFIITYHAKTDEIDDFSRAKNGNEKALYLLQHNGYKAFYHGTPEGTRTPNIQNRNLTLYPIELRTQIDHANVV